MKFNQRNEKLRHIHKSGLAVAFLVAAIAAVGITSLLPSATSARAEECSNNNCTFGGATIVCSNGACGVEDEDAQMSYPLPQTPPAPAPSTDGGTNGLIISHPAFHFATFRLV